MSESTACYDPIHDGNRPAMPEEYTVSLTKYMTLASCFTSDIIFLFFSLRYEK